MEARGSRHVHDADADVERNVGAVVRIQDTGFGIAEGRAGSSTGDAPRELRTVELATADNLLFSKSNLRSPLCLSI